VHLEGCVENEFGKLIFGKDVFGVSIHGKRGLPSGAPQASISARHARFGPSPLPFASFASFA
jgi:hypothetical protein